MTTFLLNSPVLSTYGSYSFEGPVSVDQAQQVLRDGFVSAIGHDSAAAFLSELLHLPVSHNRIRIEMQAGDTAVVLRLLERLPEGEVLTTAQTQDFPYELGILRRTT